MTLHAMTNFKWSVLVACLITVCSSPLTANEKTCKMLENPTFDRVLRGEKYVPATKKSFLELRELKLSGDMLTLGGRQLRVNRRNEYEGFFNILCKKNMNDWSPCGDITGKIVLRRLNENSIDGVLHTPWMWGRGLPPLTDVQYSCSSSGKTVKAESVSSKEKRTVVSDFIKDVFKSLALKERREVQVILKKDGLYASSIDGLYGKGTRKAITGFAKQNGYSVANNRAVSTTLSAILEQGKTNKQTEVVVSATVELNQNQNEQPKPSNDTSSSTVKTVTLDKKSETTIAAKSAGSLEVSSDNILSLAASAEAYETKWQSVSSAEEAVLVANEVQANVAMFIAIREVIEKQPETMRDRVLGAVDQKIASLQAQRNLITRELTSKFSTPIKPTNVNLGVSAFRAADTFPRVPYYVPGTTEIGEMLVIPRVSNDGYLNYQFDFIDPTASYDNVRDSLLVPHDAIHLLIESMGKIDEWTVIAQENNVTRRLAKTAACIPVDGCEVKQAGSSSTEVIFQIYEDGSTSGRIQLNKGKFNVGYNMSVESSILLQAYLIYMKEVGAEEFNIGVMSDSEVLDLFE